jgi:hypothetical protein
MKFHAFGCGEGCLVDVDSCDGVAVARWSANGVVEEDDALCTLYVVQQKFFNLGIIDCFYLCVVFELVLVAWYVLICVKGVSIEVEFVLLAAKILECHLLPIVSPVALRYAGRRFDIVVWRCAILWCFKER